VSPIEHTNACGPHGSWTAFGGTPARIRSAWDGLGLDPAAAGALEEVLLGEEPAADGGGRGVPDGRDVIDELGLAGHEVDGHQYVAPVGCERTSPMCSSQGSPAPHSANRADLSRSSWSPNTRSDDSRPATAGP
jgi:hypothetical protein